jgi:hypothetical protein
MANKIGEVLEIEPIESYIKRPAGPLITIELKDISNVATLLWPSVGVKPNTWKK